jgi:hypothetical protein
VSDDSTGKGDATLLGPTLVERVLAAIPLPYVVTCPLLALVVGGPGYLVARFLDTRDWSDALATAYGPLLPLPLWRSIPLVAASIGFQLYLFLMVRYSRRHVLRYAKGIVALLPDREAGFVRIFGGIQRRIPVVALALTFGIFIVVFLSDVPTANLGLFQLALVAVAFVLVPLVDAQVIWTYLVTLWGLSRLGKEDLRLVPPAEDPMRGLRPLGSIALGSTSLFFGAMGLVVVQVVLQPGAARPAYLAFVAVLLVFGATLFVLPLLSIHRLMITAKVREREAVQAREAATYAVHESDGPTAEPSLREVRDLLLRTHRILIHRGDERRTETLPTWPFDTAAIGRIALLTLSGVIAVAGRALVDLFLLR